MIYCKTYDFAWLLATAAKTEKMIAVWEKEAEETNENLLLDFFPPKYRHAPNKHKNPTPNANH